MSAKVIAFPGVKLSKMTFKKRKPNAAARPVSAIPWLYGVDAREEQEALAITAEAFVRMRARGKAPSA